MQNFTPSLKLYQGDIFFLAQTTVIAAKRHKNINNEARDVIAWAATTLCAKDSASANPIVKQYECTVDILGKCVAIRGVLAFNTLATKNFCKNKYCNSAQFHAFWKIMCFYSAATLRIFKWMHKIGQQQKISGIW